MPDLIQTLLPPRAQDIYRDAFNHAWQEYRDPAQRRGSESPTGTAHRAAWAAVAGEYTRGPRGTWVRKEDLRQAERAASGESGGERS